MNKPFLLRPACKDYLWGGERLKKDFHKDSTMVPLAETWECSTHPDGASIVDSGSEKGKTLTEVLHAHPEYIGTHPHTKDELPILVKLIDAQKDLSVQVHPDDDYALKYENSLGKSELWYVLDACQGAKLVYGFAHDMTPQEVLESLENKTIEKHLQKVNVMKDDVFFVKAGTVHAIGEGVLVAEIQESSNLTYRLYDYDRKDKNGNPRQLHIDRAMEVMDMKFSGEPRQPMRVLKYRKGYASELLGRCKYFQVERILINSAEGIIPVRTGSNSFEVLLCIGGSGVLKGTDQLPFEKGQCIFLPADSEEMHLEGKAELLRICC
ncbi:MAG: class I mannose-6-phosphate isomerase [Solobacterium sp.]|nr:class I mannose-6-phosphate isomerase [Solobacterium sp.]